MKTQHKFSLIVASFAFAAALPAWSAEPAQEKSAQSDAKTSAPALAQSDAKTTAQADKEKKRSVTPHNHMRDGKGLWVPEKKSSKGKKKESSEASNSASTGDAKN